MTLQPLLEASLAIQIHVVTALAALILGAVVLWRRKGTAGHRAAGRVWMALMVVTAATSLFIHEIRVIGPFSPIHLLSIVILVSAPVAIIAARRGEIEKHRSTVRGMFIGLVLAGVLTLFPGRIIYRTVFGDGFDLNFGWELATALALALAGLGALVSWRMEGRRDR